MNAIHQLTAALSALAPILTQLKKQASATVRYELLSDSLIWSDEWPSGSDYDTEVLRYIFRHRTGLIIGESESTFAIVWEEAVRVFPTWIGFLPERTTFNPDLAEVYHNEQAGFYKQLGINE